MISMRTLAAAFCVFGCLPVSSSAAQGIELSGAWANQESACAKMFTKRDNRIAFTEDADSFGNGFIVEADRIRGRFATCTIQSRKQEGGVLHVMTSCSTDVALQHVQFSLKIEGANRIVRLFPGISELDRPYFRCSF